MNKVLTQIEFLGEVLNVYGKSEQDIVDDKVKFYPKEIAEVIEHSNSRKMVKDANLDEEDVFPNEIIGVTYGYGNETRTRTQSVTLVSEDGLYDILFASQLPKAKEWKKEVKKQLKESKDGVIFTRQRKQSAKDHNRLHNEVNDTGRAIKLDIELSEMCSYLLDLPQINRKEGIYQLKKSNIKLYDEIMETAINCVKAFKLLDSNSYITNVIQSLKNKFIDDEDKYQEYKDTHETIKEDFKSGLIVGFGDNARRI